MQFELPFISLRPRPAAEAQHWLRVGSHHLQLRLVPNRRARRYVLRLNRDGTARVTIPRGGSAVEAQRFAQRHVPWLEKQLLRQATRPAFPRKWEIGATILFRGEPVRLGVGPEGKLSLVQVGTEVVRVRDAGADLRPEIESFLWELARRELTARTFQLASTNRIAIRRVSVRNQSSRWGSCSRRGTISLNWRLIQAPQFVSDYIVYHELAHVKEMNHSARFWQEVARLCPTFQQAERWLKRHSELLL